MIRKHTRFSGLAVVVLLLATFPASGVRAEQDEASEGGETTPSVIECVSLPAARLQLNDLDWMSVEDKRWKEISSDGFSNVQWLCPNTRADVSDRLDEVLQPGIVSQNQEWERKVHRHEVRSSIARARVCGKRMREPSLKTKWGASGSCPVNSMPALSEPSGAKVGAGQNSKRMRKGSSNGERIPKGGENSAGRKSSLGGGTLELCPPKIRRNRTKGPRKAAIVFATPPVGGQQYLPAPV